MAIFGNLFETPTTDKQGLSNIRYQSATANKLEMFTMILTYGINDDLRLFMIAVNMLNITRITLSHNKLRSIPPGLANLVNLEILNLFNNAIEELPISISSLPKLRILNLGFV